MPSTICVYLIQCQVYFFRPLYTGVLAITIPAEYTAMGTAVNVTPNENAKIEIMGARNIQAVGSYTLTPLGLPCRFHCIQTRGPPRISCRPFQ
jgi:hypothetical protein